MTNLTERGVGLKVLTGQGAQIDTTTPAAQLSFGSSPLWPNSKANTFGKEPWQASKPRAPEDERVAENFALSKAQVRIAQAAMANRDTAVIERDELGIKPLTLYRYVDPNGNLRAYGNALGAWRGVYFAGQISTRPRHRYDLTTIKLFDDPTNIYFH